MVPPQKLSLEVDGKEVAQASPATFERQTMSSGGERLLISVPFDQPDLLRTLFKELPPPYYVLYMSFTRRGRG